MHDSALQQLRERVFTTSDKWRQIIQAMPFDALHETEFLERVKRSAAYFAEQLHDILVEPIVRTARVETNNKQASRRLGNAQPDMRQTWLARCYLLQKIAEQGFSVETYLHEKQMSMLDAFPGEAPRKRRKAKKGDKGRK